VYIYAAFSRYRRSAWKDAAAKINNPRFDRSVGKSRIDLVIERVDDLHGRVLWRANERPRDETADRGRKNLIADKKTRLMSGRVSDNTSDHSTGLIVLAHKCTDARTTNLARRTSPIALHPRACARASNY
jgi:hypothetical protein